jgi:hypothetical protein
MRVLICGSRTFSNPGPIHNTLCRLIEKHGIDHVVIIEGEAKGADSLARTYAEFMGIAVEKFPADWNKYGKRAGFLRNKQMLEEGKPEMVLAFKDKPESRGTDMMINLARESDIPTYVWIEKP